MSVEVLPGAVEAFHDAVMSTCSGPEKRAEKSTNMLLNTLHHRGMYIAKPQAQRSSIT